MKRLVVFILVWSGVVLVFRRVLMANPLSGGPFGAPIGHRAIAWTGTELGADTVVAAGLHRFSVSESFGAR